MFFAEIKACNFITKVDRLSGGPMIILMQYEVILC